MPDCYHCRFNGDVKCSSSNQTRQPIPEVEAGQSAYERIEEKNIIRCKCQCHQSRQQQSPRDGLIEELTEYFQYFVALKAPKMSAQAESMYA